MGKWEIGTRSDVEDKGKGKREKGEKGERKRVI